MQERDGAFDGRSPLETLLARSDAPALEYIVDRLIRDEDVVPADAPAAQGSQGGSPIAEMQVEG